VGWGPCDLPGWGLVGLPGGSLVERWLSRPAGRGLGDPVEQWPRGVAARLAVAWSAHGAEACQEAALLFFQ
jgi:hypothetical protein